MEDVGVAAGSVVAAAAAAGIVVAGIDYQSDEADDYLVAATHVLAGGGSGCRHDVVD